MIAIIAILIAIAIPIFTAQLEKSREATDLANVRSAYAEVTASYLSDGEAHTAEVPMQSNPDDCVTSESEKVAGVNVEVILTGDSPCVVAVDADGKVTINDEEATTSYVS